MARQTRAVTEPQREGSTSAHTGSDEVGFNPPEAPYFKVGASDGDASGHYRKRKQRYFTDMQKATALTGKLPP